MPPFVVKFTEKEWPSDRILFTEIQADTRADAIDLWINSHFGMDKNQEIWEKVPDFMKNNKLELFVKQDFLEDMKRP